VVIDQRYFLRLQNSFDTLEAKRRIATKLEDIVPYNAEKAA
jgi:hypothetical protein